MMPFVSKIRMFLDPSRYVILDNKLLKIWTSATRTLFHDIKKGAKETAICISPHNEACYNRWCGSAGESPVRISPLMAILLSTLRGASGSW